jgi:hypothetical protein
LVLGNFLGFTSIDDKIVPIRGLNVFSTLLSLQNDNMKQPH